VLLFVALRSWRRFLSVLSSSGLVELAGTHHPRHQTSQPGTIDQCEEHQFMPGRMKNALALAAKMRFEPGSRCEKTCFPAVAIWLYFIPQQQE